MRGGAAREERRDSTRKTLQGREAVALDGRAAREDLGAVEDEVDALVVLDARPVENGEQAQEVLLLRDVPDPRLEVRSEPRLHLRQK